MWTTDARHMKNAGATYAQIADKFGVSRQRVEQVVNGRKSRSGPRHEDSEKTKRRRLMRRWCRRNAQAFGLTVEAMYKTHGVEDL